LFRVARAVMVVLSGCVFGHTLCATANSYTTAQYIKFATVGHPRHAQYSVPLHDALFILERDIWCTPFVQTLYDVQAWGMAIYMWLLCLPTICLQPRSAVFEHCAVVLMCHIVFMCLTQVATTLPGSAGIQDCLDANPTGVAGWPWYGVSFFSQGFAGGRACADMLYSGHVFGMFQLLFVVVSHRDEIGFTSNIILYLLPCLMCVVGTLGLLVCQDHYTCDMVLAVGIAYLLVSNPKILALSESWAQANCRVEECLMPSSNIEKKAK